jgi:hypothetical protein
MSMKRSFTLLAIGVLLGATIAATGVSSASTRRTRGHIVRFDLVSIVDGGAAGPTVVGGGTDTGMDAATGDTVDLTGTGQAKPGLQDVAGGGTFIHRHSDGSEVAHGVWVVASFRSWTPASGALPITDAIGHQSQAHSGILALNVTIYPVGGSPLAGVLTINCALPGAPPQIKEGITLDVGPFHFTQAGGGTLFHILG